MTGAAEPRAPSRSRILHIWQSNYPWEVRVGKINRSLMAAGFDVRVVARRGEGEPASAEVDSVSISRVGTPGLPLLSTPVPGNPLWRRGIDRALVEFDPDAVLVRDLPLALTAGKLARKRRKPVFFDMAEHYPAAMRSWRKYSSNVVFKTLVHDWRLPDRIEARTIPLMDGILVVCEEHKERLLREYSYPPERICVVRNTPETEAWAGVPKGSARRSPCHFGYHGVLNEGREFEVVLKGFDLACARDPELRLLVAGGGESEASLRALAGRLASRDKIDFVGRYAPEELTALYSRPDFGVVSLRSNAFTQNTLANKLFDYAALGKPFIYPDLKPLRRVMARMNCGAAFEPGSPESAARAIAELRRADYGRLSRNGLEAVSREFNWGVDSARMLEFLRRPRKAPGAC
jgi:glycosyltransferase involved in cell wall biosynthesis